MRSTVWFIMCNYLCNSPIKCFVSVTADLTLRESRSSCTAVITSLASSAVCWHFYRPQKKLWEGNVFVPVCQSFCSRGREVLSLAGGAILSRGSVKGDSMKEPTHWSTSGQYASYWNAFFYVNYTTELVCFESDYSLNEGSAEDLGKRSGCIIINSGQLANLFIIDMILRANMRMSTSKRRLW